MKRTPEQKKIARQSRSRALRAGGYSSFAVVLVVLIAIAANMAVAALPSSITKIDVTEQSMYSLSDQTRRIVSTIEVPVTLTLIATKGQEDSTVTTLLERYQALSDLVTVETVDPTVTPSILNQYQNEDLRQNSVIVKSETRDRFVSYSDIYVYNYTMNYQTYSYDYTVDFDGENALTSAIHYVTSADLPTVYALTGHGETALSETAQSLVENDNMTIEDLSLLSLEAVPEDADSIIIMSPQTDISSDEAEMLIDYLDAGGSIVLNTEYIASGEMENLLTVTSHMGLTATEGIIVEGDGQMCLRGYNYYLLPTINSHDITDPLISGGYYALSPVSQGIAKLDGTQATVTSLLTTSDSAYAKIAGYEMTSTDKEDGDIDGPFDVAAASVLGEGKLVWFASAGIFTDEVNSMVSGANYNLALNALNWMCEQAESISIRSKSLETSQLTVPAAQSALFSTLFVGLVPLALLAMGLVIWYRRKRA
ncbi:MAG: GldG family protein [Clostridia bacterium]|nr:GldG family protein [Clostridia bacterium]